MPNITVDWGLKNYAEVTIRVKKQEKTMSNENRIKTQMKGYLINLKKIPGDFGEFGVFKGTIFKELVPIAKYQNKVVYGFDSFSGMGEPTEFDMVDGIQEYPKGKLDTKGCGKLVQELENMGYERHKDYFLWEGFIPESLQKVSNIQFSFGYVDLDHYKPTILALEWLWDRLSINGIVLCDDYFPNRGCLASKAIDEFLNSYKDKIKILDRHSWITYDVPNKQISFRKIDE